MIHDSNTADTPSVRRVILGLISDYGSISHDLLVATAHAETDADLAAVRETVAALEARGEIYRVGDTWKVTDA